MNHFDLIRKSKSRIQAISIFYVILSLIPIFLIFLSGNINSLPLYLIKLIVIGIIIYFLYEGKEWAINGIVFIAVISIIQAAVQLLNLENYFQLLLYATSIICFISIIYYLKTSDEIYKFIVLRKNGYSANEYEEKSITEIIPNQNLIKLKNKDFKNTKDYIKLIDSLINKAKTRNDQYSSLQKNDSIEININGEIFNIDINQRVNGFDRQVVYKLNKIIWQLKVGKYLELVNPNSIIFPDKNSLHLALVDDYNRKELLKYGYLRNTSIN